MGRYSSKLHKLADAIESQTNRTVKDVLKYCLDVAVRSTVNDSSNAAVHWVLVPDGQRPRSPWLTGRDLRLKGGAKRRKAIRHRLFSRTGPGVVGKRREHRSVKNPNMVERVSSYVRERENKEVLSNFVKGRSTAVKKFTLYNAILAGKMGETIKTKEDYARHANLEYAATNAKTAAEQRLAMLLSARIKSVTNSKG